MVASPGARVFADYLKELQKVALLAPAEERELWRRYRLHGHADSRLRLIEAYQPLVFKMVMQIRPPHAVLMDMIQEGTVGLIEAVERFDPARGVRFSTFATYRIRGRVLNSLRRDHRVEYSLDQEGLDEAPLASRLADVASDLALASVEDDAVLARVHQVIAGLPDRERTILHATYVLAQKPHAVAAALRISLSHFYRLQKQAIERMRQVVLDEMHQPGEATGY